MALPIFAITIFVSAFLLFLVQPLIGKLILPALGGTPQVWNTCMVFFQSVLLLGYAYTHTVSTKLKLRQQLMVHSCLLALPIVVMLLFPVYTTVKGDETSAGWVPPPGANPIVSTLGLLALIIGVPFFVVSTSAPLLQKWFAYSGHGTAKDPYYLYSVSNLGSLLSLFFYPALIEPFTFLSDQAHIWFAGYVLLAALIVYCAYTIFKLAPPDEQIAAEHAAAELAATAPAPQATTPAPAPAPAAPAPETAIKAAPAPSVPRSHRKKGAKVAARTEDARQTTTAAPSIAAPPPPLVVRGAAAEMTWLRRIRWVLLAAVPSSMMLGVTSYISTDLSPFPLVWIIPLALYLLSFILVYEKGIKWTSKRYLIFGAAQGGYTLHQKIVYFGQPIGILILCWIAIHRNFDPVGAVLLIMLGFFANALACHGELAEDRPDTKHLTEYFLAMSVGGMIGGFFNGIVAPVLFQTGVLEFYIVIVVACLVRPLYQTTGWFDDLILQAFPGFQTWVRTQGDEMAKSMGRPAPHSTYLFSAFLDIALAVFVLSIAYWFQGGIVYRTLDVLKLTRNEWSGYLMRFCIYVVPMIFVFFFAGRPARLGLGVLGLLLGFVYFLGENPDPFGIERVLERKRTYFGVLRVEQRWQYPKDKEEEILFMRTEMLTTRDNEKVRAPFFYTYLMHGTTYHGRNYKYENDYDLSRLATTYYHRYGPVGTVMERDNWFSGAAVDLDENGKSKTKGSNPFPPAINPKERRPGQQNDYSADVRMPVSMIGQMVAGLGVHQAPLPVLVDSWSEPAFATIGLGTGTMAGYARPYQFMTYYEIDDVIKNFSLPEDKSEAHFTFLQNAIRRGVNLEVIMGDARLSLEPRREADNKENSFRYWANFNKINKAPQRAYGDADYEYQQSTSPDREKSRHREGFYKVINVDAFSSDAIPVHLVTKQAIAIYMSKLTHDGVLMVHTSNRHMDLVRPVARIAMELSTESKKKGEKLAESMAFKDDKAREAFLKSFEIHCLVGKDDGSVEERDTNRRNPTHYTGHYGSEYVMIYKGDHFTDYVKALEARKEEFTQNALDFRDKKEGSDSKVMMKSDGHAPDGWQILNSLHVSAELPGTLSWYNPYKDHIRAVRGRAVRDPITINDRLWTDDYSHILSVVRWHMPWE